jgi:hypothetical protein
MDEDILFEDDDLLEDVWSPKEVASSMKRLIIQKHFKNKEETCAICLEHMYEKMCEYLPCAHVFHYKCLGQLIGNKTYTCPLCRYDFKDTLTLVGMQILEELQPVVSNFTFTVFTNMDLYDFVLELLWRRYQIEAHDVIESQDEI